VCDDNLPFLPLPTMRLIRMIPVGRNTYRIASNQSRIFSSESTQRKSWKIKKVLIANRGEISIRISRACKEMGIKSLAIYSKEDEQALHRVVANESTLIGAGLNPVQAYLSVPSIIEAAKKHGADAIHPGYGFLSERADFADQIEQNGLMFIGPHHSVVHMMGEKTQARQIAIKAGVPVIPGTDDVVVDGEAAKAYCEKIGFPVMLKAAYGGGGRGMRKVYDKNEIVAAFNQASSEALSAFGNGSMFIEKLMEGARHIEVQIMGDQSGDIVHLYERDCSVQRRNQKVVEIAPAPSLDENVRQAILADAVKLCKAVGYQNAGTVEFLLGADNKHYFIEVNARLQVEHTVTEEVTGVDLVKTQIRVREGQTLKSLGLEQKDISVRGSAIQCRVTTENSMRGFIPDTGRIDHFRPAGGPGVRIDGAIAASGAVVMPHYDSLLMKLTVRGSNYNEAVERSIRALSETRIRGVITNIPFLQNVFLNETFRKGIANTKFIDEYPSLFQSTDQTEYASQSLLNFLANVTVNGPPTALVNKDAAIPSRGLAHPPLSVVMPSAAGSWSMAPDGLDAPNIPTRQLHGFKHIFATEGAAGVVKAMRAHQGVLLTDTTMRDAHQSLFATRMRTFDMARVAKSTSTLLPQLFSVENWGGATFDVAYRFLKENPWERLELLRELMPNHLFQMLLRGANAVGYTAYPDNAVEKFCVEAVKSGIDVFRIFDSLNYMDNMKLGINAVGAAGGIVEAAISYTGDVGDPRRGPYNLEYYLDLARKLVDQDIHILCIKDMAGLLTPTSADLLVGALRKEFPNTPLHIHTHDTTGTGVAAMVAAARAGADCVDCATDALSGLTSQPSMGAIIASLKNTSLDTRIPIEDSSKLSDYWEEVRGFYAPFDCTSTIKAGSSDVFQHEIPGGQYTNLHMQSWSLGLGGQWKDIKKAYREANLLCGDIIKVTPSSKVVGDLAQFMVQNKLTQDNIFEKAPTLSFPTSVIEYFQGYLGQPPFGFPETFRSLVLKGKPKIEGRPGASLAPIDWEKLREELKMKYERNITDQELVSSVMYPKVLDEYDEFRKIYGTQVSKIPTPQFFTGMKTGEEIEVDLAGRAITIKYLTKSPVLPDGTRDVYYEVLGVPRTANVPDKTCEASVKRHAKAEPSNEKHIGAPMPGNILEYKVKSGDVVAVGDPLVVLSAMKMETTLVAVTPGIVDFIELENGATITAGDLLMSMK